MTGNLFGDRYQVGETLGYGGMSEVHRGRDLRLGRDVAIKVLRSDLARDPSFLTRFRREAQNAASLNHPAIVAVFDTGETSGDGGTVPYIVMEYVDGETLRDLVKREGPLAPKRAMEIVADVCAALDFSHRHGIIHRDVKPANVMLTRAGAVKVMDFGIARAATDGQATVTATAAVIGTAQYLSPEQARGEAVDARSDVYATGCVLYELLTGNPPFSGDSPVAVAYQHVREDPKPPSQIRTGIGKDLDAIVLKALNKNPMNRYQTAAEMRSDLVRALSGQAVHATPVMDDADRTEMMAPAVAGLGGLAAAGGAAGATGVAGAAQGSILTPSAQTWEDDDGRNRRVWGFVGIAALCVALLAGGIFFVMKITGGPPPTPQTTVPGVQGLTLEAATAAIVEKNLVVADPVESAPSSEENKGLVIKQDPSADVVRDQGSAVKLVIGAGIEQVTVPNVLGMESEKALAEIRDHGLVPREEKVSSPTVAVDRVADQDPQPLEVVEPNTEVIVYISQGAEMTTVPSEDKLIGVPVEEAEAALDEAHLKYVSQTRASEKPKDEVLALGGDEKPGDAVQVDTVITLIISDESMMKMPDLGKLTPEEAAARLMSEDVGWSGDFDFLQKIPAPDPNSALWGRVVSQIPKTGDIVSKDSLVSVTIGEEPKIAVPDLSGMTQKEVEKALKDAKWAGQLKIVTENALTAPPGKGLTVIPDSQSPASGDEILMSGTVTIHLYPEEAPEPPPDDGNGDGPGNGNGNGPGGGGGDDEGDGFRRNPGTVNRGNWWWDLPGWGDGSRGSR